MPRFSLISILLLAACGPAQAPGDMTNGAAAPQPGAPDNRIDCRVGGAARFERLCSVESAEGANGRVLTVRKPDGGFRRLLITSDGRGVIAADGAERAHVTLIEGGRIEVEIGGDIFRMPAVVRTR